MKRMILVAAITLMMGSMATAALQIANTKHNFAAAGDGYAWAEGQICRPCHTPHHAMDAAISADMWNHKLSTATYTLYDGTESTAVDQDMDRVSRLCLGCHDGTVALDAFGLDPETGARSDGTASNRGSVAGAFKTSAGHKGLANNLGQDFSNDHPVGKTAAYPTAGSSSFKAAAPGSRGGMAVGSLNLASEGGSYYVGCKTCHNPHGAGAADNTPYAYLLRTNPADLCLTCHNK